MRTLTVFILVAAVLASSATSASASATAYATWNAGPSTDPDWIAGGYPAWSDHAGFDWIVHLDGLAQAVSGWPFGSAGKYPDSDGVDKWGGALKDDVGDGCMYVTVQYGLEYPEQPLTFVDAQGTVDFWFKPLWDPAEDTNAHSLLFVNRSDTNEDGLFIHYNGDGTMTTQMRNYSDLIDVGHDWDVNPLIANDWNHVAVCWDSAGTYTYSNGVKVGETLYSGPSGHGDLNGDGFVGHVDLDIVLAMWGRSGALITDPRADVNDDDFVGQSDLDYVLGGWGHTPPPDPAKMNWAQDWMGAFFGAKAGYTSHQSDGLWDEFVVWNEVRYVGDTYTMPDEQLFYPTATSPVPEPTTLLLLAVSGWALIRRQRR